MTIIPVFLSDKRFDLGNITHRKSSHDSEEFHTHGWESRVSTSSRAVQAADAMCFVTGLFLDRASESNAAESVKTLAKAGHNLQHGISLAHHFDP